MKINISEEEQRQCFMEQWTDSDTVLVCEVPVFCRSVDLVIYDEKKDVITSIEFKTKDWKRAVEQVMSTSAAFDHLEICIQKPRTLVSQQKILQYCSDRDVGVYFFDTENRLFEHSLKPHAMHKVWHVQKEQAVMFVKRTHRIDME